MRRLKELTRSTEPQIAELASIVLDAARVKPDKRRRFKFLANHQPGLLRQRIRIGLYTHDWDEQHNDWDAFDWQDAQIEADFHTYVSYGPDEILNGWAKRCHPPFLLGLAAERSAVTKAAWLPEPNGFGRLGSEQPCYKHVRTVRPSHSISP